MVYRNHLAIEELLLAKALTSQLIRDCDEQGRSKILQAFDKEIKRLHSLHLEFIDAPALNPSVDFSKLAKQVKELEASVEEVEALRKSHP